MGLKGIYDLAGDSTNKPRRNISSDPPIEREFKSELEFASAASGDGMFAIVVHHSSPLL